MKTAIIGGGKACRAVLEMVHEKRLVSLNLELVGIHARHSQSPGMVYARHIGVPTYNRMEDLLAVPGLEMVIELVGSDSLLKQLYSMIPPGVRVMDHVLAKVFADLENVGAALEHQLLLWEELQAELRTERNLLENVLDSLPDVVVVVDPKQKLRLVNKRLEQFTGLTREDLEPGGRFEDLFGKLQISLGPSSLNPVAEVAQTGEPLHFIYMHPGGEKVGQSYFRVVVSPVFDQKGRLTHLVETARPMTDEVLQTRDMVERESRFRQLVDNALDIITMKDIKGRYLVVNKEAATLFGLTPRDCIGRSDHELLPAPVAGLFAAKNRQTLERKGSWHSRESLTVDGRRRYFDTVRFPLWDYKGEAKGVCSISREVTEQLRLERAVIQADKMAAIGKLAAGVAHEINNPLTGVLTFATELENDIKQRLPGDPALAGFEVIIREALRCRQIVSGLLDFTRLQAQKKAGMDLNLVLERALGLVRGQKDFKNVSFRLEPGQDLPPAAFDPNQIQQVFLNLILNAADAMDYQGEVSIGTGRDASGQELRAWVADQGPGVPPQMQKRVFEPFFSTKGGRGNGLGLSVVQSIIEQHGGSVGLANLDEGGARFAFSLPLCG